MSKSQQRLGRGLSAILGSRATATLDPAPTAAPAVMANPDGGVSEIPIDAIEPNPHQPRATFDSTTLAELAESIRLKGVLQPILLRTLPDGRLQLVAGERRWRAARLAGLATVPALVRPITDLDATEIALIENLQREDLGPLERARAYQDFMGRFSVTAEQLAARIGESRANVTNYLRLLKLRPEVQELISTGQLGMGQARAIVGITDPQRQLAIAQLAVRRNLSVRQVEQLTRQPADAPTRQTANLEAASANRHVQELERTLSRSLGLAVRLQPGRKKNSGRIVIRYNSLEEFDRIAERLGGNVTLE